MQNLLKLMPSWCWCLRTTMILVTFLIPKDTKNKKVMFPYFYQSRTLVAVSMRAWAAVCSLGYAISFTFLMQYLQILKEPAL